VETVKHKKAINKGKRKAGKMEGSRGIKKKERKKHKKGKQ
jgi:hypothetical protein